MHAQAHHHHHHHHHSTPSLSLSSTQLGKLAGQVYRHDLTGKLEAALRASNAQVGGWLRRKNTGHLCLGF